MRRSACSLLFLSLFCSILAPAAGGDGPPRLDDVLRQVEALLDAGGESPHQFADAAVALQMAAPAPGHETTPADLVAVLAGQLEQLAAEHGRAPPERHQELLRRAAATLDLLLAKLQPTAPAHEHSLTATLPANDDCAAAIALTTGTVLGSTSGATRDGEASCGDSASSPDAWYSYTAASAGLVVWDTPESMMDTVLSLHSACPDAAGAHELTCNDDSFGTLTSLVARNWPPARRCWCG